MAFPARLSVVQRTEPILRHFHFVEHRLVRLVRGLVERTVAFRVETRHGFLRRLLRGDAGHSGEHDCAYDDISHVISLSIRLALVLRPVGVRRSEDTSGHSAAGCLNDRVARCLSRARTIPERAPYFEWSISTSLLNLERRPDRRSDTQLIVPFGSLLCFISVQRLRYSTGSCQLSLSEYNAGARRYRECGLHTT